MLAVEFVDHAVARHASTVAVTDGMLSLTYAQVDALTSDIANALLAAGVEPGTHISIISPNHPMVLPCQYAIYRAGCIYTPGNYRNAAADTVRQFDKLDVTCLFYHSSAQSYVESVAAGLDRPVKLIPIDQPASGLPDVATWARGFSERAALPEVRLDDVIYIGATGGTTSGQIKGAVHTNRTWENNIANFYALHTFKTRPIHIVVAPLSHAANIFHWGLLGYGATNILCPSADPDTILATIERHRGTFIFLPPTIIYMLLAHPRLKDYDLSSLEYMVFGAAPMSVEKLREAIAAFGPVLCQGFGSTETLIMNTFMSREEVTEAVQTPDLNYRLASAGRQSPLSLIAIMDDEGNTLPPRQNGEIVVRSTSVMQGYYKDPEKTSAAQVFGWHHTNDIGYIDDCGYVYVVDRKNDMIISGGFNVYPGEVEQVVLSHPAVRDCAVVGIPHDKWGEMVLAAVELKDGASLDESEFMGFCKERLGSVRAPKAVEVLDEMPRSPVGKTLRRAVRDRHWAGQSRQI